MRYGWPPLRTPTLCACGASFSVDHVLSCPKGGLPSFRHNEIRDLTATLLTEVCSQVCTEPELQPVHNPDEFHLSTSNTQEGACLDIAMNGFWGSRSERCFIDVRVLIHLPHLTVLHHFLLPLRSMRISSAELMVREFVRLSMLLLHLSSCWQQGGWLTKPQFSISIWLPSYWLSGVMWCWVGFGAGLALVLSWLFSAPLGYSVHSRCVFIHWCLH